jgi:hypothetical protein
LLAIPRRDGEAAVATWDVLTLGTLSTG